ncbi:hypothetical protein [Gemmatimonas groenlandica]|uniref:Uncharacterized protein n=1 Tax=Gemmatimonas groenlandica TaxID=2732249 RepID=A0A6M4ITH8_9BACT|nr:hypothetical protein [Gemmatimonas groenlandica]QJR36786.1 hypothetical protein HKW67_15305 [Gemmatimonas groenlandica]
MQYRTPFNSVSMVRFLKLVLVSAFAHFQPGALLVAQTAPSLQAPAQPADSINILRTKQKFFSDSLAFYAEMKSRLEQRAEQLNKDTTTATRLILSAVQDSLRETNRRYGGVQSRVSDLGSQITVLASEQLRQLDSEKRRLGLALNAAATETDKAKIRIEQLKNEKSADSALAIKREEVVRELAKLKANVAGWENLGGVVSTVSLTAQQLLIFPEADSGLVSKGQSMLQWVGFGSALAGSLIAARGNTTSGSAMIGGGLTVSALIQRAFGSNPKLRQVATRVARNVGFTDDVNSLANLTPTFRADAERLRGELDGLNGNDTPTEQQLNTYFKLVSQQRAIFAILSAIKARGQFLLDSFGDDVSAKSKGSMNRLIQEAERATSRWYSYEPVLLQPYELLLRQKRGF